MNRIIITIWYSLFSTFFAVPLFAEKPNIIFILTDDLGYGDVGVLFQNQRKGVQIKTPELDQMAVSGTILNRHYCPAPICAPSRASLITGLHQGHSNVRNMQFDKAIEDNWNFANTLKIAGYFTIHLGKYGLQGWGHSPDKWAGYPTKRGFDYFYGFYNQRRAHSYYPEYIWENTRKVTLYGNENEYNHQYTHNLFADKAINFIDINQQIPFFLYLPMCIPHSRYELPDNGIYTHKKGWTDLQKKYAAMITRLDETVGRIVKRLEALGIADNTYIFFSSDNGPAEIEEEWEIFNSNGIYRGMKRDPYEGGIRVPFIVYHPKKIVPGLESNQVGYFADFFPTVMELIGAKIENSFDGKSIVGILHGTQQSFERDPLYWEFYEKKGWRATRFGKWKAIQNNLHECHDGPIELYDLYLDAGENIDLSQSYPQIVEEAKKIFKISSFQSEHYFWNFQQKGTTNIYNN